MRDYNAWRYERNLALNIKPSFAYDGKENFVSWQTRARAKLAELLCMPTVKGDDTPRILNVQETAEYKRIDFDFESEPGYRVASSIVIPKAVKVPVPVLIGLQGHSTGMHISHGETKFDGDDDLLARWHEDYAVRAVKEGFCAVLLEQRYMGVSGHAENGHPACLGILDNAAMPALLIGRTAIGERVWDVSRMIDVLQKHFTDVADCSNLICMGNSGGGVTTFYASCMDERIRVSVPSCAFCTYDASIMAIKHCPCNFIPNIRKYFNMGDLSGLIAPRKLVIVSGMKDPIFPIGPAEESFEVTKKLYAAAGAGNLCRHVKGSEGHRFYPDDAWPVIHELLKK